MDEIVTITDTVGLPNQMIDLSKIIYTIRGKQVMFDSDLAILYGYEVKRLNEQVKNNINRFPEDFMFQMTKEEVKDLRSKFSTANINPKSRSLPHVFTEQGIYMLATVLNGEIAEKQSIFIMRAFREMRHFIMNNERMFERINSEVLKMSVPDVYLYEDILYSNNALLLSMLCDVLSSEKIVDETENGVASVTYILEHFIKTTAKKLLRIILLVRVLIYGKILKVLQNGCTRIARKVLMRRIYSMSFR